MSNPSSSSQRIRALAQIFDDEQAATRLRTRAIAELAQIPGEAAVAALVAATATNSPTVLLVALRALGCRGDATTLAALSAAARHPSATVARQARYAAALIVHRLDLPAEPALQLPEETRYRPLPAERSALRISPASAADVAAAVDSLGATGLPLSKQVGFHLVCEQAEWLILLHAMLVGSRGPAALAGRKAVPLLLAARSGANDEYRSALTVLSAPRTGPARLSLTVCDAGGRVAYAGEARLGAAELFVTIRTVPGSSAMPLHFEAGFDGHALTMGRAETATAVPSRMEAIDGTRLVRRVQLDEPEGVRQ